MKLKHQTILRLLAVILMTAGFFGGVSRAFAISGSGTQGDPYKISEEADWKFLCQLVNSENGNEYPWAVLTTDITVNVSTQNDLYQKMLGRPIQIGTATKYCYFRGNFDGHGHTLEFRLNYNINGVKKDIGQYMAPFSRASGATIRNLKVTGSINIPHRGASGSDDQYMFAGGIVGFAGDNTVIHNCISNVTIQSNIYGEGSHGGIVGFVNVYSSIAITDCSFTGKLLGSDTYRCGGLVGAGKNSSTANVSNCLFAPEEITMGTGGSSTISRSSGTITNCYYKTSFGATGGQGTNASSMSTVDLVAGLNTGATSGNESWVMHNNQYYLKPFYHYVDIMGWVSGFSANAPEIKGAHSTNSIVYAYYSDDGVYSLGYDPPTASGHYRVSATVAPGNTADGDYWNGWNDIMKFCVVSAPTGATLTYNYNAQALLVNGGSAAVGTFYYKLGADGEWSTSFPTATKAGDYKVYYYVKGDAYHNDIISDSYFVPVTIAPMTVNSETGNLKIEVPATVTYTGSALTPAVTVKDGDKVIDPSEYTVNYSNNVNVGDVPVVTIIDKTGGNYDVSGTTTFTIVKAAPTYTAPQAKDLTYNMGVQELITAGSTSHGTIYYSTDGTNFSTSTSALIGTEAKVYPTYYKLIGDANHTDVGNGTDNPYVYLPVTIKPKPLTSPEIILSTDVFYYDGMAKTPSVTVRDGGTVIPASEYTVEFKDNVNAGTATVTLKDNPNGNYAVSGTTHFSIIAQTPGVTPPTPISGLIYNASLQNLIMVGTAVGGTMEYSLDGTNFSTSIPQGKDAKQYAVYYHVKGDGNHEDTEPVMIYATISPKTVSGPVISLSSTSLVYTGSELKPEVTVKDGKTVIDPSEYTVEYSNNVNVGTGMVIIMDKSGGNYIVNGSTTFQIISADLGITPPTPKANLVYNGQDQPLIEPGKAEGGTMEYSLDRATYTTEIPTGKEAKEYKVYYRVDGDPNHQDEVATSLSVTISPKVVSQPTIILEPANFVYDGAEKQPAVTVKDGDYVIPATEYTVKYKDNTAVGTGTVVISDKDGGNYTVTGTAEFSIIAAVAGVTLPEAKSGLVYNMAEQELIVPGSAVGAKMEYSLDNKNYSTKIPTGKDAKKYTVYFRVVGDESHASMDPVSMVVTISPKSLTNPTVELNPSTFFYDGTEKTPEVTVKDGNTVVPASEYSVSYSNNVNIGTATVHLTNKTGNYIISLTVTFSIYDPNMDFVAPTAKSGLVYNGKAQELVTAGVAVDGVMVYSLDNKEFSAVIPTATDAGTYKVYYMVKNLNTGTATKSGTLTVIISKQTVILSVSLTGAPESVPSITVTDEQGNLVPSNCYTTTISTSNGEPVTPVGNRLEVGDYVLTVRPIGNYEGPAVSISFHVRRAYSFVFTMKSDVIGVCLPYDKEVPNNYHVYYFDRVGQDGNPVFKRILLTKMNGGEPYLLKRVESSAARGETRGSTTIDLTPSNLGLIDMSLPVKSQTNQNMVFTGTFDDMTNTKALTEGAYLLQANGTWKPLDSATPKNDDVCLDAFLAYIRMKDRTTPYASLQTKMVDSNDEPEPDPIPSAINALILEDEDGHQEWYDLQGRRIEAPQKGVNILRTEDGKTRKVVVR